MWDWHEKMIPLLREEIVNCNDVMGRETERRAYGPFLSLLPVEKLSIITILELLRLHNSSGIADGMKTARAVIDVGKAVEMEYNATYLKRTTKMGEIQNMASYGKQISLAVRKASIQQQEAAAATATSLDSNDQPSSSTTLSTTQPSDLTTDPWNPVWPNSIRAKVGSVLTSLLIDSAKIPVPSYNPDTGEKITEHIPAFFHTYQYVRGKRVGIIKFSDQLTKLVSKEPLRDTLHPRLMPMIVHPRSWLRYNDGGYLSAKSMCMRIKDSPEQLMYLYKASENSKIDNVLKGLDVLGSTKWRVNKQVFDVVLEAWNSGEAIADIPPSITEPMVLPEKPADYATDPKAKFNYHSLRCDVNYKVETARAVSDSVVKLV
jgi:DNA-directed RNA polymerase